MRKGCGLGDATTEASIEQRATVYGSSRNCYEQLREAIWESLATQNLLPFSSETGRTSPDSGSPGTVCSVSERKKVKMPNVVARLMGLEELPSYDQGTEKPCRSDQRFEMKRNPRKWEIEERELPPKSRQRTQDGDDYSRELLCTTDMALSRLYQSSDESRGPRRRELEKIIGSVQLTDILKDHLSHGKGFPRSRLVNHVVSTVYSQKKEMDSAKLEEIPPIVIIKPMVLSKPHRKDLEKGNMFQLKLEELFQNGKKQKADIFNKPGRLKRTSAILKDPVKSKREVIGNKPRRKPTSLENHGRKFMVFSRSLAEPKAEKLRKPWNKSSLRKKPAERCTSTSKSGAPLGLRACELIKFHDRIGGGREKAKPVVASKHKMASSKCMGDVVLNPTREEAPSSAVAGCPSLLQLHKQNLKDSAGKQLKGMSTTKFSGSSVENEHKRHYGARINPIGIAKPQAHNTISLDYSIVGKKNEVKQLLLRSSSVLSAAQECFDIDVTGSVCPMNYMEFDASSKKIITDCVLEVITHKRRETSLKGILIMNPYQQSKKERISLDALVEELCHDLEDLLNYQIMDESCSNGGLCVFMKRDLLCRRCDIRCMWDFGWETTVLAEQSELLFSQFETYVLGALIEETVEAFCDS